MKKNIPLIAVALFMFCIVPTAAALAIPRNVPNEVTVASIPPNAVPSVFNHKGLTDMITEFGNPEIKNGFLPCDLQKLRATRIAKDDKEETKPPTVKKNPYVKRRGHGRSKMGDAIVVEDKNSKNGDNGEAEEDDGEREENELPDDDSSVKYNKRLKNSSGYNEDL